MNRDAETEFDRQVGVLLDRGYPALAGITEPEFAAVVEPLRDLVRTEVPVLDGRGTTSRVPFVVVTPPAAIRAEDLVPTLSLVDGGQAGILDRNHGEAGLAPYRPLPWLGVPDSGAYLLLDVERGEEFCGVRPEDALPVVRGRGRSPLTVHEGIALVTAFPAVLERNRCFMLAGSRRGDRRVPALWISGRAPKLGWCWDGNPHSWLGTASTARRVSAQPGGHGDGGAEGVGSGAAGPVPVGAEWSPGRRGPGDTVSPGPRRHPGGLRPGSA